MSQDIPAAYGGTPLEVVRFEPDIYDAKFTGFRTKKPDGTQLSGEHGAFAIAEFEVQGKTIGVAVNLVDREGTFAILPTANNKIGKIIVALGGKIPEPDQSFSFMPLIGKACRVSLVDDTFKLRDGTMKTRSKIESVIRKGAKK